MMTMTINKTKKTTTNGGRVNMPQSDDEERCDRFIFSFSFFFLIQAHPSEQNG